MEIAGTPVGPAEQPYVIGEAGVNHNGDIDMARELVGVAADSGADAVKFQTFKAEELVVESAAKAPYQVTTTGEGGQYELLKRYELDRQEHLEIRAACEEHGITFLSTPFDPGSVDLLDALDVPAIKLGSGELTNHPILERVAELDRPMIVSTGMGTMAEVRAAYNAIRETNQSVPLALLHCTSAYPTPVSEVNLRAMQSLDAAFPVPVGLSDHTTRTEVPGFAVAAGATIVEKHFTLDRSLPGPDHEASLEPDELSRAVELARLADTTMGDAEKRPTPSELENKQAARKSLHVTEDIEAGETLTADDVTVARPESGLAPTEVDRILGRTVATSLTAGDPVTEDVLDGAEKS